MNPGWKKKIKNVISFLYKRICCLPIEHGLWSPCCIRNSPLAPLCSWWKEVGISRDWFISPALGVSARRGEYYSPRIKEKVEQHQLEFGELTFSYLSQIKWILPAIFVLSKLFKTGGASDFLKCWHVSAGLLHTEPINLSPFIVFLPPCGPSFHAKVSQLLFHSSYHNGSSHHCLWFVFPAGSPLCSFWLWS